MNKKALEWEMIGKIVLVMAVMLILILIIYALRGGMNELWEGIMNIFRFGG